MSRFSLGLSRLFHPRAFALAFAVSLLLLVVLAALLPGLLTFVGPAIGGAVVADRRRYLEVTLAGALAAGVGVVLSPLLAGGEPAGAAIGTSTGALAALAGHHVARRFR